MLGRGGVADFCGEDARQGGVARAGASQSGADRGEPGGHWRAAKETGDARTAADARNSIAGSGRGSRSSPEARKKQRQRPGAAAGGRGERRQRLREEERSKTYCSDTMLGIDELYSLGAKSHNI
jgi:hypothetical protein